MPVLSSVLVVVFAHFLIGSVVFDPLLAAQNKRIRFQGGGDSAAAAGNLATGEITLAEDVMQKNRIIDPQQTQLMYIGNSQTIAIMDQNPGDLISPQWLQILLRRAKSDATPAVEVNIGSLPNLTMPELLIKIVAAREAHPRQADIVIASAVLEEFRGLGVRDEVARLVETPAVKLRLAELLSQNPDLPSTHRALASLVGPGANVPSSGRSNLSAASFAARVEDRLQNLISKLPVFSRREDIQGFVYLDYYNCRNRVLGINSASIRPVPDSAYKTSLETIELALRYAQAEHIKLVIYLAPIRPVQPNPNLPSDVATFRKDVPALCARYGTNCFDYVDLVPENLWTNYPDNAPGTEGQRDYAHFTGAGHKLVAETLLKDIWQLRSDSAPGLATARK